jgi:hypothetical protein
MAYFTLAGDMKLALPRVFFENQPVLVLFFILMQLIVLFLGVDIFVTGLFDLFKGRIGAESLVSNCVSYGDCRQHRDSNVGQPGFGPAFLHCHILFNGMRHVGDKAWKIGVQAYIQGNGLDAAPHNRIRRVGKGRCRNCSYKKARVIQRFYIKMHGKRSGRTGLFQDGSIADNRISGFFRIIVGRKGAGSCFPA